VTLDRTEISAEVRELLGLDPVSLVIKKGRVRWFRRMEHKDNAGWINCCTTMEVYGGDGQEMVGWF